MAEARKARPDDRGDLARVLDKLETRSAEGYGALSFRAKAVGKTDDSIHLAVATGIVSVPLKDILSIKSIPGQSELNVLVEVQNGDRVTHLRHVPDTISHPVIPGTINGFDGPFTWPPRVPPGGWPNTGADGGASTSTNEDIGMDTTSTTGGEQDQTDDHRPFHVGDTD
jgi:hypothetical protein